MKAILQRVTEAKVKINNGETRSIGKGLVILLGVGVNDAEKDAEKLAEKIVNLRIFPNEEGKFDKCLLDICGEALVVSQFTLYGDCEKGRRPDFTKAARPEKAVPLYERFIKCLKEFKVKTETGEFAADMMVEIHNDGPVTISLDSNDI
ncbi:MAG: D-aminoacyl-tRNA deacylase [Elusimicrobiota bacterium]